MHVAFGRFISDGTVDNDLGFVLGEDAMRTEAGFGFGGGDWHHEE